MHQIALELAAKMFENVISHLIDFKGLSQSSFKILYDVTPT